MKILTIAALVFSISAAAEDNIGQCIIPKSIKKDIYIYNSPNTKSQKTVIKTFEAYTIGAEAKGGFVQLVATPGWDMTPNENAGQIVGWAKLADFKFQALRNCN